MPDINQDNSPTYLIYSPPRAGLPFLSVQLSGSKVIATPFDTEAEALAHNYRLIGNQRGDHSSH